MALPIIPIIVIVGRVALHVALKRGVPAAAAAIRVSSRPVKEFAFGALKGEARALPLGNAGGTVSTVFASTRAGIQVRQGSIALTKALAVRGPRASLAATKYAVRSLARDSLVVPHTATHIYQFVRATRAARGISTPVERILDKAVLRSGRILDKAGLAPTIRGTVATWGRIALVGAAVKGIDVTRGRIAGLQEVLVDAQTQLESMRPHTPAIVVESPPPVIAPSAPPILPLPAPVIEEKKPAVVVPPQVPTRSRRPNIVIKQ